MTYTLAEKSQDPDLRHSLTPPYETFREGMPILEI